jgi:prepilin-type N-terminal cleavage/methylation domain-containing protein/prepilin-type processing-associated H-X9-DG protein
MGPRAAFISTDSPRLARPKNGFTLVEMLVVVAIIGILAAVLMMAITAAIKTAQRAKCSSNLRSIGIALLTYSGDNDGLMPESGATIALSTPSHPVTDPTTGLPSWIEQLAPYAGTNYQLYRCPSALSKANLVSNYFQGCHAAYVANNGQFAPLQIRRISDLSSYILAGDMPRIDTFWEQDADKDDYTQDTPFNGVTAASIANNPSAGPGPHQGGSNILYADGHVSFEHGFDQTRMSTHYEGVGYPYLTP